MTKTFSENGEALLTRRGAVEHIKNTRGIPLTLAAVNKFAMQGRGPKPDRYYGRRELFKPKTVDEWAETLLSDGPKKLGLR